MEAQTLSSQLFGTPVATLEEQLFNSSPVEVNEDPIPAEDTNYQVSLESQLFNDNSEQVSTTDTLEQQLFANVEADPNVKALDALADAVSAGTAGVYGVVEMLSPGLDSSKLAEYVGANFTNCVFNITL